MKKLITCASLAAVGAMTVDAQPIGDPSVSKLWSVSAKLRGFYDDNYNTGPSASSAGQRPAKADSWGISFSPSVALNYLKELTTINFRYDYDMRWYEDRANNEVDHAHRADLQLFHDFSERFRLELKDQFVYSREPDVLTGDSASFYRTDNSNIRNHAAIGLVADITETIGTRVGYDNTFYDYDEKGAGSRSALLDRVIHKASIDLRRVMQPTTTALVGYQFAYTDMTSSDLLANPFLVPGAPAAEFRDQRSHYGFVGVDHSMTTKLTARARAGVQYADYFRADEDFIAPYVDAALSYMYREGSQATIGVRHGIGATDVAMTLNSSAVTLASQSTTVYAAVSHRITPNLIGFVRGAWQGGEYLGGPFDGEFDNFINVDVNLTYEVTKYLAVEAGYLFDYLDSDIVVDGKRGYTRNRGYVGVKATY